MYSGQMPTSDVLVADSRWRNDADVLRNRFIQSVSAPSKRVAVRLRGQRLVDEPGLMRTTTRVMTVSGTTKLIMVPLKAVSASWDWAAKIRYVV